VDEVEIPRCTGTLAPLPTAAASLSPAPLAVQMAPETLDQTLRAVGVDTLVARLRADHVTANAAGAQ
jgi:hypothetical protein